MDTYQCECCHNVYAKPISDDEAAAEYARRFPDSAAKGEHAVVVCDDCYHQIIAWGLSKLPPL